MPTRDVRGDAVGAAHAGRAVGQLEGITADEATQQAIEDWRYWVKRGYEL
jgi:hypothetical protein